MVSWIEVGGVKCFQISKVFGLRDIWVLMRTPIETKHQKDVHVASWFHEWNGFPWDAACIDPTLVSEFWKWSRFIVLREDPPAHYLWVVIVFGVWWLHHYFVLATLVASTNPLRPACSKRCGPPWCDMPSFSYTSFWFSLTLKHNIVYQRTLLHQRTSYWTCGSWLSQPHRKCWLRSVFFKCCFRR